MVLSSKSPNGAILFHSPGRKPWVNRFQHPLSSVGAALPQSQHKRPHPHNDTNQTCALKVPLLKELNLLLSVCTQGFISGLPSFHPGLCRSIALTGLISASAKRVFYFEGLIYVSPPIYLLCCFEAVCVGRAFQKDKFCLFFCWALQNAVIARH